MRNRIIIYSILIFCAGIAVGMMLIINFLAGLILNI